MSSETEPSTSTPEAAAIPAGPSKAMKACANCSAPMHGPFCYACGQPEKGMIRHLASVMADVADTIFNVDSRIFRSLLPLYFRPGYLTVEYFAGRRTRYVTPFRLFFFLCVISFFAIQISLNIGSSNFQLVGAGNTGGVNKATTEAEVQQRMKAALDGLDKARAATAGTHVAEAGLDKAAAEVRAEAAKRSAWLKATQEADAKGVKPPPDPDADDENGTLSFDGVPWDPVAHPITVDWLPAFANAKLNEMAQHGKENMLAAKNNPSQAIARLFSVAPQTLFVLMPLFAVLLKIVYLFKRRLYMEHLMVALHSHAFIFMSLLLIALVTLLHGWAATSAPAALPLLNLLRAAIWTWLPIYLFLMQKKVYRQGWFMTTFKYGLIGISYVVLLCIGFAGALIASLTIV
ncbi:MAG: DUF3667 domain-containing protein [Dokdonella sp.]